MHEKNQQLIQSLLRVIDLQANVELFARFNGLWGYLDRSDVVSINIFSLDSRDFINWV